MSGSRERVAKAFAHEAPDRTPLFEVFWPYHPIYWDICGRNPATDEALRWDAQAEGISAEELLELEAQTKLKMWKFFGLDAVMVSRSAAGEPKRPVKLGDKRWSLDDVEYVFDEKSKLVRKAKFSASDSDSHRATEEQRRAEIEAWDRTVRSPSPDQFALFRRIRELAEAEGLDWAYMAEAGPGTGVAFYPPFQLMWFETEPDLIRRWLQMSASQTSEDTKALVAEGCDIIVTGGDVSCDKGPFCSPRHYHEFILPVIQEHVALIQSLGAKAVYTSDGNHWPIKEDFFFNSGIDGYLEVDYAAGMTFERLIEEGVADRICILGNVDQRHLMCLGTPGEVKEHVRHCLKLGRQTPGGHILHTSHSIHEDVKVENAYAMFDAYRDYFGMPPLARP